jgi:hypothetical protein
LVSRRYKVEQNIEGYPHLKVGVSFIYAEVFNSLIYIRYLNSVVKEREKRMSTSLKSRWRRRR